MKKIDRKIIFNKFNGLCAYTGKMLGHDWQVDHIQPCKHTWGEKEKRVNPNVIIGTHKIDNLFPAIKIINHYKRDSSLEEFRKSMMTFHLRLKKLPKNTIVQRTKKRIIYMNTIADLFDITIDKPFNGKFYFETIINKND